MTDVASGARQSIHAERPAGTRAILALHGLLAADYLLGAGVTALVAAVRSGHYEGLLNADLAAGLRARERKPRGAAAGLVRGVR
ncbi:hypothetical protein [Micromonospora sp. NPDC006431]|uniref:hypothetical protein n=1 Tax=Micromonospora sp. NPDC006431 TaxID=3364235 RepID=UPI0036B20153